MEELFGNTFHNKFSVVKHEDNETHKKINLKFEIKKTDTIREILDKIAISCNDTINGNLIFAFINYPKISKDQIEELEQKIITDKNLLKLLKDNFKDFKDLNKNSKFYDKNEKKLKEISPKRGWSSWLSQKSVQYQKGLNKLKAKEDDSELFKNIIPISHTIEDIKLDIFSDKKLDQNLINNDNSIKSLNIEDKLENTIDYFSSIGSSSYVVKDSGLK